jgi:hypothetical protein
MVAVGDPAEAVGDAHANPLLAADDGPDTAQSSGFNDWGRGEARKVLNTFSLENLCYCLNGIQWDRLLKSADLLAGISAGIREETVSETKAGPQPGF